MIDHTVKNKLAYLGPCGTFCEEAACRYIENADWDLLPYASIEQVFAAVHAGETDSGIVPIENSCEGSVNQTMDLLAYEYDLKISGEIIVPVKQNLLVRPGLKSEEITVILSHPQALAQCRKYLNRYFHGIELIDVASTAEAARRVAESKHAWAAIGTMAAARSYGLNVISPEIQDRKNNETRFVTLTRDVIIDDQNTKTSLLLYLMNKPGALFKALEQFYLYNVNLTKIESRPAQTRIGEYLFFIDIEGNEQEPRVINALAGLKSITHNIRILGSYRSAMQNTYQ